MPVTVKIQTLLQKWFDGKGEVQARGDTIGECIDHLEERYPGLGERLKVTVILLNGDAVQALSGPDTKVKDGDEIHLLPRMSGG